MVNQKNKLSRRDVIKQTSIVGTAAAFGGMAGHSATAGIQDAKEQIGKRAAELPLIDTHEHLIEEEDRVSGNHQRIKANDWSFLLTHYIDSDLRTSGMPNEEFQKFLSPDVDPIRKWDILEPYWPNVRYTGYGQAVEIAIQELYGVEGLSRENIPHVQAEYERLIRPGFYSEVLQNVAGIESCQVNFLSEPFSESKQPTLLMQDISILGMHMGPNINAYAPKAGIEVKDLSDWHAVIDWWFKKYGPYAVAVKSQAAYSRNIDFEKVPAEKAAPVFAKKLAGDPISSKERKALEDHLFWYSVEKATEWNLPVKLHTGYYAGHNSMPLSRLQGNPGAVTDLCRNAPDTTFVFMHICYPYYEELIAAAKQWRNAYIDMCWAWIISPTASVDFLKEYLVTAPANKVLTFGGDYIIVELVSGHASLARRGIRNALVGLVDEGWLTLDGALALSERIMHGNAREIFNLNEKTKRLQSAPWL